MKSFLASRAFQSRINLLLGLFTFFGLIYFYFFRTIDVFPDTPEYLVLSSSSFFSIEFWKGIVLPSSRPGVVVFFYSLLKDIHLITFVQVLLHGAAWLFLAYRIKTLSEFSSLSESPLSGMLRLFWIVLGAFYFEYYEWTSIPLSESITHSFLLFWLASLLNPHSPLLPLFSSIPIFSRAPVRRGSVGKFFYILGPVFSLLFYFGFYFLLLSPRDTNAYLVLPLAGIIFGVHFLGLTPQGKPGGFSPHFLLKIAASLAVAFLLMFLNSRAHRYRHAMDHVIQNRVNPSDTLRPIFQNLGMPFYQASFCEPVSQKLRIERQDICKEQMRNYYDWLTNHSKSTLIRFLITYPRHSLVEIARELLELTQGDFLVKYHADQFPKFYDKKLSNAFWIFGNEIRENRWRFAFGTWALLLALMLIKSGYKKRWRDSLHSPVFVISFTMPFAGILNIWLNYHVDTIEIQRHCMQAFLFIKLGILIQIFYILDFLELENYLWKWSVWNEDIDHWRIRLFRFLPGGPFFERKFGRREP